MCSLWDLCAELSTSCGGSGLLNNIADNVSNAIGQAGDVVSNAIDYAGQVVENALNGITP